MFLKLNHSLQLQYDGFISKLAGYFESEGIYVIEDDLLMAVGRPACPVISLIHGGVSAQDEFDPDAADKTEEIEEGTLRNEVLRYVLMRLKRILDIKPVADDHMLETLRGKLNFSLKFYDIEIAPEKENRVTDITLQGEHITIENLLRVVADETIIQQIIGDIDMDYLMRLVGLGRFDEALGMFLTLQERVRPDSMFGTEVNMYLGELYFHLDDLEKSVECYKKCNPLYIKDMKDYHIRLGHSLLDGKPGLRAGLLKMYYGCLLNSAFKKSIADKYDRLVEQVEPIYAAHEAECETTGAAAVSH